MSTQRPACKNRINLKEAHMSKRSIRFIGTFVAVSCVATVLTMFQLAGAQDQQQQPAAPQASPEHAILKADVGKWDCEMTLYPGEGAPPMVSKGTETCELLPGGMWLLSRFEGEMMGLPFSGA